jgi:hypothetical protein
MEHRVGGWRSASLEVGGSGKIADFGFVISRFEMCLLTSDF